MQDVPGTGSETVKNSRVLYHYNSCCGWWCIRTVAVMNRTVRAGCNRAELKWGRIIIRLYDFEQLRSG